MKKGSFVLIFLTFCSLIVFAQNLGDVNSDNTITIVDALMVAQYYVGLIQTFTVPTCADVNCDGNITIVDALMIAQYYVGLINQLC